MFTENFALLVYFAPSLKNETISYNIWREQQLNTLPWRHKQLSETVPSDRWRTLPKSYVQGKIVLWQTYAWCTLNVIGHRLSSTISWHAVVREFLTALINTSFVYNMRQYAF